MAGFRTTVEKKKDPTGDRVVITLDGKVHRCTTVCIKLITVPALLVHRPMGHVSVQVKVSRSVIEERRPNEAERVVDEVVERMECELRSRRFASAS
jgi:hypothetical protein